MATTALPIAKIKGLVSLPPELRKSAGGMMFRVGRDEGAHVRLEQLYRWGASEGLNGPDVRAILAALICEDKLTKTVPGKDPLNVGDSDTVCLTSKGQATLTAARMEALARTRARLASLARVLASASIRAAVRVAWPLLVRQTVSLSPTFSGSFPGTVLVSLSSQMRAARMARTSGPFSPSLAPQR